MIVLKREKNIAMNSLNFFSID